MESKKVIRVEEIRDLRNCFRDANKALDYFKETGDRKKFKDWLNKWKDLVGREV